MKLYRIRDWSIQFENNRSRTVKELSWVAIPNRHDGENYTAVITSKDGAEIFSAWVLMVQVASRCHPRGSLVRGNGSPHDSASLAIKTRAPKSWFDKALKFLTENTDWVEITELAYGCQDDDTCLPPSCQSGDEGGKGMEGNGTGGEGSAFGSASPSGVREVSDAWNEVADNVKLPKIAVVSDKRRRQIEARLRDAFFRENWRAALSKISGLEFCKGQNDRGWVASFDWFVSPDAVAKIIEGKYDNRSKVSGSNNSGRSRPATGAEQRQVGIPEIDHGISTSDLVELQQQQLRKEREQREQAAKDKLATEAVRV